MHNELAIAAAYILPYLKTGSDEIAKSIGKDVWEKIKHTFQKKENQQLLIESNDTALLEKIQQILKENPQVVNTVIQQIGDKNVFIQNSSNNSITF